MGLQQQLLRAGRLLESAGPCSATQGCVLGANCAAPTSTVLQCCSKIVGKASDGAQMQQKEGFFLCVFIDLQELSSNQVLAFLGIATCQRQVLKSSAMILRPIRTLLPACRDIESSLTPACWAVRNQPSCNRRLTSPGAFT